ncbi:MAG: hypothetical protein CVT66_01740 [Actinobacteria bacterium HGW-Actinobacteria-6]|nr:MAG: hypothetical protein CVT66_01740 [Actinobacteria bacterium HGW-Actinobacteria-6]
MPRVSDIEDVGVVNSRGMSLGRVSAVLFHPSEPRAVAVVVQRPRIGGVIARAEMYVPLGMLAREGEVLVLRANKLPSETDGERFLGYSWETTVHWRGMPVRSTEDEMIGAVNDVDISLTDGAVSLLRVSTGMLGDVAVGRLEVPGDLVEGFSGDAVIVSAAYAELKASGGAAKVAAKGATAAKEAGGRVAKQAYDASMSAAIAVGKSFKSGTGRRMIDKFKEMTRDDEE